jgi:hypothetical protein
MQQQIQAAQAQAAAAHLQAQQNAFYGALAQRQALEQAQWASLNQMTQPQLQAHMTQAFLTGDAEGARFFQQIMNQKFPSSSAPASTPRWQSYTPWR